MKFLFTITFIFLYNITRANDTRDTVRVTINLNDFNENGLMVFVYPPDYFIGLKNYVFPFSVPGNYEFLNNQKSRSDFNLVSTNETLFIPEKEKNIYLIDWKNSKSYLTYLVKSTVAENVGIYAIDSHYHKDSLYLLNWFNILGFFEQEMETPYKIVIHKNANLWGAGSLNKQILNDTTDLYVASNYKNLITNPIIYSIPDTASFKINGSKFHIAYAGTDTTLNSNKLKNLLIDPLSEVLKRSEYKHDEYTFIYYSEYSNADRYLTGLEHPNSTVICYHSALLDNDIVVSSSVHEYIHAVFAPLRIRSEIINDYDFISTKCDEYLWFYEGVTEYLAAKIMMYSGVFSPEDFLNKLKESFDYQNNVNLQETSINIFRDYNEELFYNFYSKGSLLALELDVELIKLSEGKTCLFDVMRKLQKIYSPENPFNSNDFIKVFSSLSNVDIKPFIRKKTKSREKVDLDKVVNLIGYTRFDPKRVVKNHSYPITTWVENDNIDSNLARIFWNE